MVTLNRLSSQVGDPTERSNRKVAQECLENPRLVLEIAAGLEWENSSVVGDCAEVMTIVAENRPELIAPHARALAGLVTHPKTRVRWEAMHALSLVAALSPRVIAGRLAELGEIVVADPSVIVRDHAVDAIGNYAGTGRTAAQEAYPLLKRALTVWGGKQAGHALLGLAQVAEKAPRLKPELGKIARDYFDDPRGVVRKAARALRKAITEKS